ncbi:hypothetical protein POM88_046081 [Heracleum sosnowskyi]|uniref:Peptidase C1A papain C-terminal domain-containing protein n=1 Tax=Heracleum sosnowskyi TaxID=360622 RepID=A0AAD8M6T2_9APIA|nr:hypothetical protein POM88_046081 [Heracleum sosnowskyi]
MVFMEGDFKIWAIEGIYYEVPDDTYKDLHVVVVVAMNLKENYFIIRNSWGPLWAKSGYAKVRPLLFSALLQACGGEGIKEYVSSEKVSRSKSHWRRYKGADMSKRSENKEATDPMLIEASLSLIEIQSLSHQIDRSPITPPVAVEDASKQLGVEIATRSNCVPFLSTEMISEL